MQPQWSTATKYLVAVGMIVLFVFIFYISRAVVTMLVIAALIAFVLMPIIDFFHTTIRLPRVAAILLSYLLGFIAVLFAPLIFLPPIIDGFETLSGIDYSAVFTNSVSWVETTLTNFRTITIPGIRYTIDLSNTIDPALELLRTTETEAITTPDIPNLQSIINSISPALTFTVGFAANVVGRVFSWIITFLFIIFFALYMSFDAHRFQEYFISLITEPYRPEIRQLLDRLLKIWQAYVRGMLTLVFIMGTISSLGLYILGVPGAFALGAVTGILEVLPNVGPIIAAIPAVVVALLQGSNWLEVNNLIFALIVAGFYVLIQQGEAVLITPRILGGAVKLHAIIVMAAVAIGFSVAGVLGALLATPVTASGREILRYTYAKITDRDPFPPDEDVPTPEPLVKQFWSWVAYLRTFFNKPQPEQQKPK